MGTEQSLVNSPELKQNLLDVEAGGGLFWILMGVCYVCLRDCNGAEGENLVN